MYRIVSYFHDNENDQPATGLSPVVTVYRVSDSEKVVDAQAMTEIGDGFYKYEFSDYDGQDYVSLSYASSQPVGARYTVTQAFQIPESGPGDNEYTYTVTNADTGQPEPDVLVWITTDEDGNHVLAKTRTDSNGQAAFLLDPGTYYAWSRKAGFSFDNPDEVTVT